MRNSNSKFSLSLEASLPLALSLSFSTFVALPLLFLCASLQPSINVLEEIDFSWLIRRNLSERLNKETSCI